MSPDGSRVYAAIFESGNSSTILGGGADGATISSPPNAVSDSRGPYGGVNPPPNSGSDFVPARNAAAGTPPPVGLIVKKNAAGAWFDDNNHDWTPLVSGPLASASGRPVNCAAGAIISVRMPATTFASWWILATSTTSARRQTAGRCASA